jgi:protein required for attachment to host cells
MRRPDPVSLEKEKFAHLVAVELNAAAANGEVDEVVLVAPAYVQAAIAQKLDDAVEARIIGRLDKDLVKTPDDELWPHVRTWVRPSTVRCPDEPISARKG